MLIHRIRRVGLMALAPAVLFFMRTSPAQAQLGPYTFDSSSSFTPGIAGDNFDNNLNANQYPYITLDYGGGGATPANSTETWSSTDYAGSPTSGSVELSTKFNGTVFGAGGAAFEIQLEPNPASIPTYSDLHASNVSFDIQVVPGSAADQFGGYGYFQVFTVEDSYSQDTASYAEELANPSYGSPPSPGAGVWEQESIALNPANPFFAFGLQVYNRGDMNGNFSVLIDNLQFTPVPEPATLGLLGLGIPALLMRRRAKAC